MNKIFFKSNVTIEHYTPSITRHTHSKILFSDYDNTANDMQGMQKINPEYVVFLDFLDNIIEDFGGLWKPKLNDNMFLQIGTLSIPSIVTLVNKKSIKLNLSRPACIDRDINIMISHKEDGIMKIVASGKLENGNKIVD